MPDADWPFDQPRNCASITLRSIVFHGTPILSLTHNADDHGWQFAGLADVTEADACVVAFDEAVALAPTVLQLPDLPPGWHARRPSRRAPWQRAPNPSNDAVERGEP